MRRQKFLLFRVYQFQDSQAYGELYDLYYVKIRRYVFFKLPQSADADEIASEVFLRGWEFATSSKVENPSALFYKIARNLVTDFYRHRDNTVALEEADQVPSEVDVSRGVETKMESEALIASLRRLKEEYRDVLIMRYLDELSIGEIADALEKTPNNVRVLLFRAKKALKDLNERINP
ncbi:MAG: RNA polymerase sigma factor [Patescibacteria group bacterium]